MILISETHCRVASLKHQGCQLCHCCYVTTLLAPDVISHPHKPQTIAWDDHKLLIEWHGTAVSLIMRQSLIRVLQSPTRTAVSHYLQIHLGPAPGQIQARPRLTNGKQRARYQAWLVVFQHIYISKYRKAPCVGRTALCTRVWMQLSVCEIQFECGFSCGLS